MHGCVCVCVHAGDLISPRAFPIVARPLQLPVTLYYIFFFDLFFNCPSQTRRLYACNDISKGLCLSLEKLLLTDLAESFFGEGKDFVRSVRLVWSNSAKDSRENVGKCG